MARRGIVVKAEEVVFLRQAGAWRAECVLILTRAKPQGPLYQAVERIMAGIDDLAEVVTGDRMHFHQRDATTPGPALPPVKWRTVE